MEQTAIRLDEAYDTMPRDDWNAAIDAMEQEKETLGRRHIAISRELTPLTAQMTDEEHRAFRDWRKANAS